MTTPPIYVDMDDVLCETARSFVSLLEREFGRRVAFEEIHQFDLGVSFRLTPAELERFFDLAHRPERLAALDPLPGAVDTLSGWKASGEEIAVVTGRPAATETASRGWLERHGVPHRELTFVDKYGRAGAASEAGVLPLDAVRPGSYRLAVEDSLPTAIFLAARAIPVLLIDRPWNQAPAADDAAVVDGIVRCRDWTEVRLRAPELLAASARSAAAISS